MALEVAEASDEFRCYLHGTTELTHAMRAGISISTSLSKYLLRDIGSDGVESHWIPAPRALTAMKSQTKQAKMQPKHLRLGVAMVVRLIYSNRPRNVVFVWWQRRNRRWGLPVRKVAKYAKRLSEEPSKKTPEY
ncbi:unnamed protein product [Penicillium pancosmium]